MDTYNYSLSKYSILYGGYGGYAVAQLVETLRYNPEGRGFDSLEFFIGIILPVALWPWG